MLLVVAGVEVDLAADGRHADAVAVAADAADHAADQVARARVIEAAEAQRVEVGDRPRAHGEDVAQDAADAGRRALVRLDERRVVVALDLEDHREAVADRDRAGVLARALQDARPARRQLAQHGARALVAAVLRPHDREDAELDEVGRAADRRAEALVLLGRQAVLGGLRRRRSAAPCIVQGPGGTDAARCTARRSDSVARDGAEEACAVLAAAAASRRRARGAA